jgi:20S proteasome alpha/beta subunit
MEAARRGGSFVAALIEDDQCAVIIAEATMSASSASASTLPSVSAGCNKVHRIAPNVFMVSAGLSGDARAIASTARAFCQQHQLNLGEAPTVEQVARHVANFQHELTRTGGARPLGCTAVVVGMDPVDECFKLYQTDPGGILEECICSIGGKDRLSVMKELKTRAGEIWKEERATPERNDEGSTLSAVRSISKILQSFSAATTESELAMPINVWIVRASKLRRGGIRAVCFCKVPGTDLKALFDAITESAILSTTRAAPAPF